MLNAGASARTRPYEPLCALSNGYDSSTVATIARTAGGSKEAISFDVDREGENDSGATVAQYLDMHCTIIGRQKWRSLEKPEIPFIAGSPSGSDVLYAGAESRLFGKVLFTGYYGDIAWAKKSQYDPAELARSDGSGRSLTEFRLWKNFIHCPPAFWGVRRGHELQRISQSEEMKSWNMPGSDAYNRPICRRIVEEAGVPRHVFGIRKRGVSVRLHNPESWLTPSSLDGYQAWLREYRWMWVRKGRLPPIPVVALAVDRAFSYFVFLCRWMEGKIPHRRGLNISRNLLEKAARKVQAIQNGRGAPFYLRRYTFPWATEQGKSRYSRPLELNERS